MKQTLDSLSYLFDGEIDNKLHYLDLAYDSPIKEIKKTNRDKIVLTFTNSFGGSSANFNFRGGIESLIAYRELYENGYTNLYLNLTGNIEVEPSLKSWLEVCDNVNIHTADIIRHDRPILSEEKIHNVIKGTDIFLIPSCRIHSMSIVRALCYGSIVIGSDGWGFDEFVNEQYCCKGQSYSTYIEDNLLKEKYSLSLISPNYELKDSIKNKILHIINSDMDKIKEKSLVESQERFNKNKRDENFEKILEKATND